MTPRKVGLDDYLVGGGTVENLRGLAALGVHVAHPNKKAAGPDELCGFRENCTEADDWDEPIPLSLVRNLPAFPTHCLPTWLKDYVAAVAVATQTPEDLGAMIALAVCAAAVAKKVVVRVRSDWTVPLNIYVVVVAMSGERKSAVFTLMVGPLEQLERELVREARERRRTAELRHKRAKKAAKEAENALVSADTADPAEIEAKLREAIRAKSEAEQTEPEAMPRLLADDITQEALATFLSEQGGRVAVLSAEGGILEILAGRYTEGRPNIEVFLKGHSGDALRVDRKSRGPEHIPEPAITLGLTVQPDVLHGLTRVRGFRGRGLLARMAFSLPPSNVGYRAVDPPTILETISVAYWDGVTTLGRIGTDRDVLDSYPAMRPTIELTEGATRRLHVYRQSMEDRMRPDGDLRHISDWASKMQGDVVRFAALLHMAEHQGGALDRDISEDSMARAIEIADYLTAHALAAFDEMGADPDLDDARHILAWLKAKGQPSFSKRDAYTALKGRFRRAAEIEPGLRTLEEYGYVRELPVERSGEAGRPPSPQYVVNPSVIATSADHEPAADLTPAEQSDGS